MLGLSGGIHYPRIEPSFANAKSVLYDGTNDYVDASTSAGDLNLTNGSISVWAKLTTGANNDGIISICTGTSGNDKIQIDHQTSSDVLRALYKFTSGSTTSRVASKSIAEAALISAGWVHIVATWDVDVDSLILYYNGSSAGTNTDGLTVYQTTPDRVHVGKAANANNTYWKGNIDELGIWTRTLSAKSVSEIYNGGTPKDLNEGYSAGLIQYLRFEESSGTIKDYSGNGNTASASGATQNQSETP